MSIWIEVYLSPKFMDFMVVALHKRANPTSHNIHNRMRYLISLDDLTAFMKRRHVIINCLCWAKFLRNFYPKAMSVMVCKFVIVYDLRTWCFIRIHTAIAVGFARYMIFNFRIILMVFCQLIDECFISAISTKRFGSHQKYVLYFSTLHENSLSKLKCVFQTDNSCLEVTFVNGYNLVPKPAVSMFPFILFLLIIFLFAPAYPHCS